MTTFRVVKFGGTSVGTPVRVQAALTETKAEQGAVVVVVSALNGVTDLLLTLADHALAGRHARMDMCIAQLGRRHLDHLYDLLPGVAFATSAVLFTRDLQELETLVRGPVHNPDRFRDAVVGFGEFFSARIFRQLLTHQGRQAHFCDARELIVMDPRRGPHAVDLGMTRERLQTVLRPLIQNDRVVVTQGFVARDREGDARTLGRGGSDHSATLIAALLEARDVHIRTDVDGVYSADPNLLPEACHVDRINLDEAADLAGFGAEVLHPPCLEPLRAAGLPLYVRETRIGAGKGTLISSAVSPDASRFFVSLRRRDHLLHIKPDSGDTAALAPLLEAVRANLQQVEAAFFDRTGYHILHGDQPDALLQHLDGGAFLVDHREVAVLHVFGGDPAHKLEIQHRAHQLLLEARVTVLYSGVAGKRRHAVFAVPRDQGINAARLLHKQFCLDRDPSVPSQKEHRHVHL